MLLLNHFYGNTMVGVGAAVRLCPGGIYSHQKLIKTMFANLKRSHTESEPLGAGIEQDAPALKKSKSVPQKKNEKKMLFFKDWKQGTFTPEVDKDYRGEKNVFLKDGKYNAMVTTAPLTIKYSEMGPKGNLGTRFVKENAFTSAKFTMTCERGVDSKVLAAMPNVEKDQDAYFKWLNTIGTDMLKLAWENDLPMFSKKRRECLAEAKKEAKKNKDLDVKARAFEIFLKGASLPVQEKLDEDGDGTLINKMQRRYQYNSKEGDVIINRPTIWKRKKEGGYEDITDSVKYLSKGSVVIAQVSFRCYAMTSYYGVTTDMGKNVIAVWMKPSAAKSNDDSLNVPYLE